MEKNGGEFESSSPSVVGASTKVGDSILPNKAHVTDALRSILARLDASDLRLVYEKRMETSDRSKGQNRLLMSCKCERKRAAFASIFTGTEMPLVHRPLNKTEEDEEHDNNHQHVKGKGKKKDGGECNNNGKHKNKVEDGYEDDDDECKQGQEDDDGQGKQRSTVHQGLAVEAYDCDGRMYKLNLKYLSSNTGYRIIGREWTDFLENNGLLVAGGGGVTTRKPSAAASGRRQKKRRRSSLPDYGEDEHQVAGRHATAGDIQMELWAFRSPKLSIGVKDQPGGALGLLLLHYRGRGRGGEAGTEEVAAPQEPEVVDDAAAKAKLAAPRSMPLRTLETLVAVWLSCNDPRGC